MPPKVKPIEPTNPVAKDIPWYSYFTLDVVVRVLNNSIFHPFVCCVAVLSLRGGLEVPWDDFWLQMTLGWTIFVAFLSLVEPISSRIAYGAPREVDLEEEVIVVTGGASGLGRCIAEIYALRGASVAVLDSKDPDNNNAVEGASYYQIDITDGAAVRKAWEAINEELGLPTILINSAAIVHGKRFLDLSPAEAEKTFATNVLAHFHLNALFLPPLLAHPTGGTLVTVSSVLGYLGAAHLSDYTASKAALIAYHASLRAELAAYPKLKTILATPGQLSTDLFARIEQGPVARFVGAPVDVQVLAMKIVTMVDEGRAGHVCEPAYARWIPYMFVLPAGVQKWCRGLSGVDTAMQNFSGPQANGAEAVVS